MRGDRQISQHARYRNLANELTRVRASRKAQEQSYKLWQLLKLNYNGDSLAESLHQPADRGGGDRPDKEDFSDYHKVNCRVARSYLDQILRKEH